ERGGQEGNKKRGSLNCEVTGSSSVCTRLFAAADSTFIAALAAIPSADLAFEDNPPASITTPPTATCP
ncbi:hypothetical protein CBR_g87082, partial [Chara braunii]